MTKRTRNIDKKIRLNQKELDRVNERMDDLNLKNFQTFALSMLLQGSVTNVDYGELFNLVKEVNKIGNNINQMSRLANQFSEIGKEDIKDLTEQLNILNKAVKEKLREELRIYNQF